LLLRNSEGQTTRSHRQSQKLYTKTGQEVLRGKTTQASGIYRACLKQETGQVELAQWSGILKREDVEKELEKM
jgi:hypothetical protein